MKNLPMLVAFVAVLMLSGCGNGSKQDIVKKSEGIKTKAELESKLGKPTDMTKMGPIETWTYKASDGEVTFTVMGDKVTPLTVAGPSEKK